MKLVRCSKCVMPNTRPDTPFVDGVCQACINYANRPSIDWEARKGMLTALLDRHDGRVIVPSSGGKDSTYIALTLKAMGADVTAVTATTCHLTALGRANIDNLAKHVRTIEVTPNMTVRAKLNRLGLEMVGDISWPEHASIFSVPFRMAKALGINLLMYGENPQDCYGGPQGSEQAMQMTRRWTSEYGGFLGLRPADFVGVDGITGRDMADYEFPADIGGVEAHFLGAYQEWDSRRNAEMAISAGMQLELPCVSNWWSWENLDNAQTGLHDYFGWLKYGYGRGCAQISVDVRAGRIDRESALQWVEVHDGDPGYPFVAVGSKYHYALPYPYAGVRIGDVLSRIEMTREKLDACIERFTNKAIHA